MTGAEIVFCLVLGIDIYGGIMWSTSRSFKSRFYSKTLRALCSLIWPLVVLKLVFFDFPKNEFRHLQKDLKLKVRLPKKEKKFIANF